MASSSRAARLARAMRIKTGRLGLAGLACARHRSRRIHLLACLCPTNQRLEFVDGAL